MTENLLAEGSTAPDFTLPDQDNNSITLSKVLKTKKVFLVFYPLAFSGVCQTELGYLRDRLPDFDNDTSALLTVSTSPVPALKVWATSQGYLYPLLSDFWPHGEVSKEYNVFLPDLGVSQRGSFVIDHNRKILFSEIYPPSVYRPQAHWDKALEALQQ